MPLQDTLHFNIALDPLPVKTFRYRFYFLTIQYYFSKFKFCFLTSLAYFKVSITTAMTSTCKANAFSPLITVSGTQ